MQIPDFAQTAHSPLSAQDLNFLLEHFPRRVNVAEAMANLDGFFDTVDSMLDAAYVYEALKSASRLDLPVSPRFYFNVMLRHELKCRRRTREEQGALHYLAHLLELFIRVERLHRVQAGEATSFEYLVDLLQEAAQAEGARVFVVKAQVANYALYIAGVQAPWVEYRHRFQGRPVNLEYYCALGAQHYLSAARDRLADRWRLSGVYRELGQRFAYYREGLQRMAVRHVYH